MTNPKSKNITWHESQVSRDERERLLGQRGCVAQIAGYLKERFGLRFQDGSSWVRLLDSRHGREGKQGPLPWPGLRRIDLELPSQHLHRVPLFGTGR